MQNKRHATGREQQDSGSAAGTSWHNPLGSVPFEGVEVEEPVEGERVRVLLRCIGPDPAALSSRVTQGHAAFITQVQETAAKFRPLYAGGNGGVMLPAPSTTCFFKRVFSDVESATSVANALLPIALAAAAGTSATIVCTKGSLSTSLHTLFDPDARKSMAMNLIEMIVDDCRKRNASCHLSLGATEPTGDFVCDLLGSDPNSRRPTITQIAPSLHDGTLFPSMYQVNIGSNVRRPAEVLFSGLQQLAKFQETVSIRRTADVFAIITVTVKVPGAGDVVSRLTLIDIGSAASFGDLQLSRSDRLDPFIGHRTLKLLTFGVMCANRVVVLASLPTLARRDDADIFATCVALQQAITYPVNSVQSKSFSSSLAARSALTAEMHAAAAMRELCRLRVKLNGDGVSGGGDGAALLDPRQSRALTEQLAADFASVLADLKATSSILADRLPELLGDEIFDDQSASLANHRSELIRQVETEQSRRLAWLEQYHDWLLQLPVVDTSGGLDGALEAATRMSVLEKSVTLLKEENLRLRQLFARDVALLKGELAAAQQAVAAAQPTTSPFDPTIRAFLEDVDIVLRGVNDPAESHRVLPRTMHLIDELTAALRHDATLFLDPASPENVQATVDAGRLLFTAALDKLRRALRIPVEPPTPHVSVSRDYWEALVFERQACRAERHKLRAVAESLALHASRMVTGLGSFAKEVEDFVAKHATDNVGGSGAGGGGGSGSGSFRPVRVVAVGGTSGATAIERLLLSEMDNEPVAAAGRHHGLHASQKLSTAPLLYAMEKCGAMVETLRDVVDGVIRQVPMAKQARVELPLFFADSTGAGAGGGAADASPLGGSGGGAAAHSGTGGANVTSGGASFKGAGGSDPSAASRLIHAAAEAMEAQEAAVVQISLDAVINREKKPRSGRMASPGSAGLRTPRSGAGVGMGGSGGGAVAVGTRVINKGFFSRVEEKMTHTTATTPRRRAEGVTSPLASPPPRPTPR